MKRTALFLMAVCAVLLGVSVAQSQTYGESLDETEQLAVANTFQYALDNNTNGIATTWNNPDSAHSGSTIPLNTFQTPEGVNCREYQQLIIIDGKEEQGFGTACRQPDGSWRIVDSDSEFEASQGANKEIHVYQYQTYRYYNPWAFSYPYLYTYYPHHISFSFAFIHHNGHFFSGHRHFQRSKQHFRGSKQHFRGSKQHFRGSKQHFRGSKQHFRGNNHQFQGNKLQFRGNKGHSRGSFRHRGRK